MIDAKTLADAVGSAARTWPDRVFLVDNGRSVTFAEFDERTYKVPRQFVFVEEFPVAPAGKIQKSLLPREEL